MNSNTLLALRQIVTAMNEEGPMFLKEMSRDERRAFGELFGACENFLMLAEELEDAEREERDGQPDEAQEWESFDPDC
jgi:hypothetical protein